MKKKNASYIIRRAIFLTIFFFICAAQTVHAFESNSDSTRIQATPFDYKLSQAGFFMERYDNAQISQQESIDSLFLKARLFRYAHDSRQNQWQSSEETEINRSGDCKDKALWLYTQLKKNGYIHVRLVLGKYRSFDRLFHAWLLYTDNSNISYLLDPTLQKRVWEEASIASGFYKPIYSFNGRNRYRHVV